MRTLTTEQETVLGSASYDVHLRVMVEDASGSMVDLTALSGHDWVVGATWGQNVNEIVPAATIELARNQADGDSLAPLDEDSPLYSTGPTIDGGRDINIEVATIPSGDTLAGADWVTAFTGNIDEVSWHAGVMTVYARDKIGKEAADRWIEEPTEYGTSAGRALSDVMQDVLDDWADTITLNVIDDPTFLVTEYEQQQMPVLEALRTLASLVGYDIRPVYDSGSDVFELSLIEPDRNNTTADWTFDAGDYFDVRNLAINIEDVRNVCSVRYTAATGRRAQELAEDSASITRFGRRWMEIELESDSPIDTSGEAQTIATAAVNDLSIPDVEHEIDVPLFWAVEVGDVHDYTANGTHYSVDQQYAVYGYRHDVRRNTMRTTIQARGKPAGQYANWLGYASRVPNALDRERARSILNFKHTRDVENGEDNFYWEIGELVAEVQIWEATVTAPDEPADYPTDDGTPDTTIAAVSAQEHTTTIPAEGDVTLVLFVPYDIYGIPGPAITARVEKLKIDGADIVSGSIIADALIASSRRFGFTGLFSTNGAQVNWSTGTFYLANGDSYTISADTIIAAAIRPNITHIYFDADDPASDFQWTDSFATLNSSEAHVYVAACWRTNTGTGASVVPSIGILALDGENITPASIQTDRIAANAITAAKIDVASLSAISADVGTLTAGVVSGDKVWFDLDATTGDVMVVGGYTGNGTATLGDSFTITANGEVALAGDISFNNGLDSAVFGAKNINSTFFFENGNGDEIAELAANRLYFDNPTLFTVENLTGALALKADGDVTVDPGSGNAIILENLPTSDPSNPGQLWNDSGTLKIS